MIFGGENAWQRQGLGGEMGPIDRPLERVVGVARPGAQAAGEHARLDVHALERLAACATRRASRRAIRPEPSAHTANRW